MADGTSRQRTPTVTRRTFLTGAAATAGAVVGSGVMGVPTIWAQKLRDITLLQVGGSYSAIIDIARQATKDLGFKIDMQNAATDALVNRVATQPQSLDIADIEHWMPVKLLPRGVLQGIDLQRFTRWATLIPTLYNADTLGLRPDLVKRPIEHWYELLSPEFKGRTALLDVPSIGIMDAAMAIESRGDLKYADKGNMTPAEIDKTVQILIDLKKSGHFRAFWTTFDESVNLMASGEVVIQSMWSPAVTAVRARGIPCHYVPLKEGYRAWAVGLGLMAHVKGLKLDAAYEYLNWYQSGWQGGFIAKQGYYSSVPATAKSFLTADEWDYWYEGKPARREITDPYGHPLEPIGHVRDGGSLWERMGRVACWNTVMDENRHMVRKWNEFVAA
jgi:putative spermidine/putrescine transport system substrate-binding protein